MAKDKFTDFKELEKWLKNLPNDMQKEFNEVLTQYTIKTKNKMTKDAPIDTGYLRGSIQYRLNQLGNNKIESIIYVGAEYGFDVEFGTSTHMEHPFFYPAYNVYSDKFLKAMIQAFENYINS